ncbi:MAG: DUF1173 family protein [Sphingomonadales bacterium]|nr:DUF1173 family protein [Sphingomonadales bacterium]
MTQCYKFGGDVLASDDPKFLSRVALAHSRRIRPFCMCLGVGDGIEVYVARRFEKYHLKRMPNSGPAHAPGCDHYEPHDDLTGLGQLRGQAIIDDEATGETLLKLAFPMSRGPARLAMATANETKPSVKSDGTKLSIRGLLHYLWNEARLTHWHPKMRGKRGWGLVRNELLRAAEQMRRARTRRACNDDRAINLNVEDFGVTLANILHPQPVRGVTHEHGPKASVRDGREIGVFLDAFAP